LLKLVISALLVIVIIRLGVAVLRAFARPRPGPPPPGELRRVNLRYRCTLCGAEVRMTAAPEEDPAPPRHCLEEMALEATIE